MYTQLKLLLVSLSISCLMLVSVSTQAQEVIAVKGKVQDSKDSMPLPGVTVKPEKGGGGTTTNEDGNFTISVPRGSKLVFSLVGYTAKTINVSGTNLNIQLDNAQNDLEDVVVLGYGTQKKELLSGSVVTLKMDDTRRNTPTTSLGNLLAGQMAGVNVSTPNGIPGTQPGISVRVGTSFNAQNVLYVIDGKISGSGDFNNLSPNDIDNVTVLKDAASKAVYGSRAAGGVVLVTTRTGRKNSAAKIDYSFSTGFDRRGKNAPLTSAVETGELYNRIYPVADPAGWRWADSDLEYFKNINNGWGYDQLDAVWENPYTRTHNLNASGGSDKISYFIGGSYTKQGGFMKNLTFDKYNLRANITADITKNLNLFTGITINNNLMYSPTNTSVGDVPGIYRKQLLWQPDQPVWTNGGNPIDYGWIGNVGAEVRGDGGYIKGNNIKPVLNLKATYKIAAIEGLSASAQFNKSYTNNRTKTFEKQYDMWVMKKTGLHIFSTDDKDLVTLKKSSQIGKSFIQENYNWGNDYQLNFQLNYDHSFKKHNIKGWLVYEKAEANSGGAFAGRETFPVYTTDQWWAASNQRADDYGGGDTELSDGRISYVGQAFYDYDGKYLASFSSRYDGSMRFPADKRWGFFPAGSIGWVISKEKFMSGAKGIEMLKVRASAGLTGNDAIGGWQWQQSYQNGNAIFFGTAPVSNVGITYGALTNPNLTWEKTLTYNAGVDVEFLKHFTGSAEYYYIKTYDILGSRIASVPPTFSRTLPSSNYGQINAQGVEINLGYKNSTKNFSYYANLNASYGAAKYKIQDQNVTYPWQANPGKATNRIVTYQATGMIRTQADLDAFKAANPNYKFNSIAPALGQLTYADLSGPNGTPDGIVDNWDQVQVKDNNNPVVLGLNLGFEWKGFSVDATFNGNLHQSRFVNSLAGGVEWNRMWKPWYDDSWTPQNPNATYPNRIGSQDGTQSVLTTNSTFWLKNANFLRMKLLNVGYNIPSRYVNKIGISRMKFYFSGSNLFVISKFNKDYFDPEIGDGFSVPIMKTFNFGVNVSL